MGRKAKFLLAIVLAPLLAVVFGCANLRLPAIDPSGRQFFLPRPNYTTLAQDGLLSRLQGNRSRFSGNLNRGPGLLPGAPTTSIPAPGPYEPALFNRHREGWNRLGRSSSDLTQRMYDSSRRFLQGLHNPGIFSARGRRPATLFGNSAFPDVPVPPTCGPNGQAPEGSPCYPVGSPTASSLAVDLSNSDLVGTGVASNSASLGMERFRHVGPGVVLAQPRYTARVGEEVVVLGGVQSPNGIPRGGETVRWSLSNDSVGTIVDAARPPTRPRRLLGFLHRASARVATTDCGSCVASVTSDRCRVATRRPGVADDVFLNKGQTWVSLTSGSAGQSFVTLAAPDLPCGRRVATAIIEWTDSAWEFPCPQLESLQGPGQLVTKVFRNTNRTPLPNWRVRYTYIDGPKVTFDNGSAEAIDVKSDARGWAILTASPATTESGTTRFGIQIFDPQVPGQPVQQSIGYISWSESEPVGGDLLYPEEPAPGSFDDDTTIGPPRFETPSDTDVSPTTPFEPPVIEDDPESPPISTPPFGQADPPNEADPPSPGPTTPPATDPPARNTQLAIQVVQGPRNVVVGQRFPYVVEVRNTGQAPARRVSVVTDIPQRGLRLLPQGVGNPYQTANGVVWDLRDLPVGGSRQLQAVYGAVEVGTITTNFEAQANNAPRVEDRIETKIGWGDILRTETRGPEPLRPRVGEQVTFFVRVQNGSNVPQQVKLVIQKWSAGLQSVMPGNASAFEKAIYLPPGWSDPVEVPFKVVAGGTQEFEVFAELANDPTTRSPQERPVVSVDTREPRAQGKIEIDAPAVIPAGTVQRVKVWILNDGEVNLNIRDIQYTGDEELFPAPEMITRYQSSEDRMTIRLPVQANTVLEPGQNMVVDVDVQSASRPARGQGVNRVLVVSDQGDIEGIVQVGIDAPRINRRQDPVLRPTSIERPRRNARATEDTNSLHARVEVRPALVRAGEPFEMIVELSNQNPNGFRQVEVTLNLPADTRVLDYQAPPSGPAKVSKDGRHLNFGMIREIMPSERLVFRARVVSDQPGDVRANAQVEAIGLRNPLITHADYNVR